MQRTFVAAGRETSDVASETPTFSLYHRRATLAAPQKEVPLIATPKSVCCQPLEVGPSTIR